MDRKKDNSRGSVAVVRRAVSRSSSRHSSQNRDAGTEKDGAAKQRRDDSPQLLSVPQKRSPGRVSPRSNSPASASGPRLSRKDLTAEVEEDRRSDRSSSSRRGGEGNSRTDSGIQDKGKKKQQPAPSVKTVEKKGKVQTISNLTTSSPQGRSASPKGQLLQKSNKTVSKNVKVRKDQKTKGTVRIGLSVKELTPGKSPKPVHLVKPGNKSTAPNLHLGPKGQALLKKRAWSLDRGTAGRGRQRAFLNRTPVQPSAANRTSTLEANTRLSEQNIKLQSAAEHKVAPDVARGKGKDIAKSLKNVDTLLTACNSGKMEATAVGTKSQTTGKEVVQTTKDSQQSTKHEVSSDKNIEPMFGSPDQAEELGSTGIPVLDKYENGSTYSKSGKPGRKPTKPPSLQPETLPVKSPTTEHKKSGKASKKTKDVLTDSVRMQVAQHLKNLSAALKKDKEEAPGETTNITLHSPPPPVVHRSNSSSPPAANVQTLMFDLTGASAIPKQSPVLHKKPEPEKKSVQEPLKSMASKSPTAVVGAQLVRRETDSTVVIKKKPGPRCKTLVHTGNTSVNQATDYPIKLKPKSTAVGDDTEPKQEQSISEVNVVKSVSEVQKKDSTTGEMVPKRKPGRPPGAKNKKSYLLKPKRTKGSVALAMLKHKRNISVGRGRSRGRPRGRSAFVARQPRNTLKDTNDTNELSWLSDDKDKPDDDVDSKLSEDMEDGCSEVDSRMSPVVLLKQSPAAKNKLREQITPDRATRSLEAEFLDISNSTNTEVEPDGVAGKKRENSWKPPTAIRGRRRNRGQGRSSMVPRVKEDDKSGDDKAETKAAAADSQPETSALKEGSNIGPGVGSLFNPSIVNLLKDTIKMREELAKEKLRRNSQDVVESMAMDDEPIQEDHHSKPTTERSNLFDQFSSDYPEKTVTSLSGQGDNSSGTSIADIIKPQKHVVKRLKGFQIKKKPTRGRLPGMLKQLQEQKSRKDPGFVRRKPGRPRKNIQDPHFNKRDIKRILVKMVDGGQIKRKPGRPRKVRPEDTPGEGVSLVQPETVAAKPRGRRPSVKKPVVKSVTDVDASHTETEPMPQKQSNVRKRGRPRKYTTQGKTKETQEVKSDLKIEDLKVSEHKRRISSDSQMSREQVANKSEGGKQSMKVKREPTCDDVDKKDTEASVKKSAKVKAENSERKDQKEGKIQIKPKRLQGKPGRIKRAPRSNEVNKLMAALEEAKLPSEKHKTLDSILGFNVRTSRDLGVRSKMRTRKSVQGTGEPVKNKELKGVKQKQLKKGRPSNRPRGRPPRHLMLRQNQSKMGSHLVDGPEQPILRKQGHGKGRSGFKRIIQNTLSAIHSKAVETRKMFVLEEKGDKMNDLTDARNQLTLTGSEESKDYASVASRTDEGDEKGLKVDPEVMNYEVVEGVDECQFLNQDTEEEDTESIQDPDLVPPEEFEEYVSAEEEEEFDSNAEIRQENKELSDDIKDKPSKMDIQEESVNDSKLMDNSESVGNNILLQKELKDSLNSNKTEEETHSHLKRDATSEGVNTQNRGINSSEYESDERNASLVSDLEAENTSLKKHDSFAMSEQDSLNLVLDISNTPEVDEPTATTSSEYFIDPEDNAKISSDQEIVQIQEKQEIENVQEQRDSDVTENMPNIQENETFTNNNLQYEVDKVKEPEAQAQETVVGLEHDTNDFEVKSQKHDSIAQGGSLSQNTVITDAVVMSEGSNNKGTAVMDEVQQTSGLKSESEGRLSDKSVVSEIEDSCHGAINQDEDTKEILESEDTSSDSSVQEIARDVLEMVIGRVLKTTGINTEPMQQEVHELVDEDQMESGDGDSEILQDKDSEETIPEVEDSKDTCNELKDTMINSVNVTAESLAAKQRQIIYPVISADNKLVDSSTEESTAHHPISDQQSEQEEAYSRTMPDSVEEMKEVEDDLTEELSEEFSQVTGEHSSPEVVSNIGGIVLVPISVHPKTLQPEDRHNTSLEVVHTSSDSVCVHTKPATTFPVSDSASANDVVVDVNLLNSSDFVVEKTPLHAKEEDDHMASVSDTQFKACGMPETSDSQSVVVDQHLSFGSVDQVEAKIPTERPKFQKEVDGTIFSTKQDSDTDNIDKIDTATGYSVNNTLEDTERSVPDQGETYTGLTAAKGQTQTLLSEEINLAVGQEKLQVEQQESNETVKSSIKDFAFLLDASESESNAKHTPEHKLSIVQDPSVPTDAAEKDVKSPQDSEVHEVVQPQNKEDIRRSHQTEGDGNESQGNEEKLASVTETTPNSKDGSPVLQGNDGRGDAANEEREMDNLTDNNNTDVSQGTKGTVKKPLQRGMTKKQLRRERAKHIAGSRWKNIQKAQQSTKNSTGQTTGTEAHRKRKSYTKRKELDLLFDVDGPPSKMKREEGKKRLSLGEKKTILGERISLESTKREKRSVKKLDDELFYAQNAIVPPRRRHSTESELHSRKTDKVDQSTHEAKWEGAKEELMNVSHAYTENAWAASVEEEEVGQKGYSSDGGVKLARDHSENEEDRTVDESNQQEVIDSDTAKKMTTRGKKNRYWYLFAKQDRKGNVTNLLSKPENVDINDYKTYRQEMFAHSKQEKQKKEKGERKHRHSTSIQDYMPISAEIVPTPETPPTPGEEPKVPKIVLKLTNGNLAQKSPSEDETSGVSDLKVPMDEKEEPSESLQGSLLKESEQEVIKHTDYVDEEMALDEEDSEGEILTRTEYLISQCRPCSVLLVDFIKCLNLSNKTDISGMEDDSEVFTEEQLKGITSPVKALNSMSLSPNKSPYKGEDDASLQKRMKLSTSPYENEFMSFVDSKQELEKFTREKGNEKRQPRLTPSKNKPEPLNLNDEDLDKGINLSSGSASILTPISFPASLATLPDLPSSKASSTSMTSASLTPVPIMLSPLCRDSKYRPILPKGLEGTTMFLIPPVSAAGSSSSQQVLTKTSSVKITGQDIHMSTVGDIPGAMDTSVGPNTVTSDQTLLPPSKDVVTANLPATTSVVNEKEVRKTARKQMKKSQTNVPLPLAMQVRFRCLCCTYTCNSKTVMCEHIYNHTDIVPYSCGYCGSIFGTRSGVMVHTKRDHTGQAHKIIKNSPLNEEDYFTTNEKFLQMKATGTLPKLKPPGKMSVQQHAAAQETTSKSGVYVNSSAMTGVQLTSALPSMSSHPSSSEATRKSSPSRENTFKCRYCQFVSSVTSTMEEHVSQVHQKERRYVCPLCRVSFFKQLESVKKHMQKWHAGAEMAIAYEPGFHAISSSSDSTVADKQEALNAELKSVVNQHVLSAMVQQTGLISGNSSLLQRKPTARKSTTPKKAQSAETCLSEAVESRRRIKEMLKQKNTPTQRTHQREASKTQYEVGNHLETGRQHVILNVPTVTMEKQVQESTLPDLPLNEDNVIDSYGDVMTEEEGDGNELALLITEVKSLRDSGGEISEQTIIPADDQEISTEISANQKIGVSEPVKEMADSQTPEKDAQVLSTSQSECSLRRDTSPEYMCKEVSSTSELEIEATAQQPVTTDASLLNERSRQEDSTLQTKPSTLGSGVENLSPRKKKLTKVYVCKRCNRQFFNDFDTATMHLSRAHQITYSFACPYCPFSCSGQKHTTIVGHIEQYHKDKPQNIDIAIINQEDYFTVLEKELPEKPVHIKSQKPQFQSAALALASLVSGASQASSIATVASAATSSSGPLTVSTRKGFVQIEKDAEEVIFVSSAVQGVSQQTVLDSRHRAKSTREPPDYNKAIVSRITAPVVIVPSGTENKQVIVQQDDPTVITVAGSHLNQPLDFSHRDTSLDESSSRPASRALDLSCPVPPGLTLALSRPQNPGIYSTNLNRPPPPLIPMGKQLGQNPLVLRRDQAPPLSRAPLLSPSRSALKPPISPGGIPADSSSDEEDEMAKEAFSVFNLPVRGTKRGNSSMHVMGAHHVPNSRPSSREFQGVRSRGPSPAPFAAGAATPPTPADMAQYRQFQARPITTTQQPLQQQNQHQQHSLSGHRISTPNITGFQIHGNTHSRFEVKPRMTSGTLVQYVPQRFRDPRFQPPPNVTVGPGLDDIPQRFSRTLNCPYCTYKCDKTEVLHTHILTHGPNVKWTCPYCPMPNQMTKSVVEKHISKCHPGMQVMYIPFGVDTQPGLK